MNNIFKDAHFSKPYKTRDGRKARFVINMGEHYGHPYRLVIEGADHFFNYDEYGKMTNVERDYDIVSEWIIDEEELDNLAEKEYPYGYTTSLYADEDYELTNDLREAFKKGCKCVINS